MASIQNEIQTNKAKHTINNVYKKLIQPLKLALIPLFMTSCAISQWPAQQPQDSNIIATDNMNEKPIQKAEEPVISKYENETIWITSFMPQNKKAILKYYDTLMSEEIRFLDNKLFEVTAIYRAMRHPELAIKHFNTYKNKASAKFILLHALNSPIFGSIYNESSQQVLNQDFSNMLLQLKKEEYFTYILDNLEWGIPQYLFMTHLGLLEDRDLAKTYCKILLIKKPNFLKFIKESTVIFNEKELYEILILLAEEDPESTFNNYDIWKDNEYRKDILHRIAIQWEIQILRWAKMIEDETLKGEIIAETLDNLEYTLTNIYFLTKNFDIRHNVPNKEKVLNTIAKEYEQVVLRFPDIYKNLEISRKILIKIAKENPHSIIYDQENIKKYTYWNKIIDIAHDSFFENKTNILKNIPTYLEHYKLSPNDLEKVTKKAYYELIETDAQYVYFNYSRIEQEDYATDILQKLTKSTLKNRPNLILDNIHLYEESSRDTLIHQALNSLAYINPWVLYDFWYNEQYNLKNYRNDIETKAIRRLFDLDKNEFVRYYESYWNRDFADTFLYSALQKVWKTNPEIIIGNNIRFNKASINNPEIAKTIEDLLFNQAKTQPGEILKNMDQYANRWYYDSLSKEAFFKLIETNPFEIGNYIEQIKNSPIMWEVFQKICKHSTLDAIEIYNEYTTYLHRDDIHHLVKEEALTDLLLYENLLPDNELFKNSKKLFDWVHSIKEIRIGKKIVKLDPASNINIYTWLLKTYFQNKDECIVKWVVNRDKVRKMQEHAFDVFLEDLAWTNQEKSDVSVITLIATEKDDDNGAFSNRDKINEYFASLWTKHDNISDSLHLTPQKILLHIKKSIEQHPDKKHIILVWTHGTPGWEGLLWWIHRTKKEFDELYNINNSNKNIRIRVQNSSCFSNWKDENFADNNVQTIITDSSRQTSISTGIGGGGFLDLQMRSPTEKDSNWILIADFNDDWEVSYNESTLFVIMNYMYSNIITVTKNWEIIYFLS